MSRGPSTGVLAASIIALLALASCAPGYTTTADPGGYYMGFTVGTEGAPPAPVIAYATEPEFDRVGAHNVQVVTLSDDADYDMFRYHGRYYLYASGFWYQGNRYTGPFALVEVRQVPQEVLTVPDRYWRHRPWWNRLEARRHHDHGMAAY